MAETTNTSSSATSIPEWAGPYMGEMLGSAQALARTPYQAFPGQRLEDFSGLQNLSFNTAANMQVPGQFQQGSNMASQAGLAGLNTGKWPDPGNMQSYMSPYTQGVVDVQNQELLRNAEMQRNANQARAVQAGAYGGSRHGFVDSEMYRNTMQQMNNNQLTGLQAAYQSGMGQYNADRNAALQGAGLANQSAGVMGQLGQLGLAGQTGIATLQNTFGGQQQQLGQAGRDIDYQNFQQQVQHPYQQVNFLNQTLRGTNIGSNTTATNTTSAPDPSKWSQLAGIGLAGQGLWNLWNS